MAADWNHAASSRLGGVRLLVLALLSLAMADAYLTRVPGAFNTTLARELKLDNTQIGDALAGFDIGYIWLQIPGGWLGLTLGNRRAMPLMCLGWSLCAAWCSLANDGDTVFWARFGMGLCQGGLIPCSAMAVAEWFPPERRGVTSGVITSSMQIGALVALLLTAWLLDHRMDWRIIMRMYAVVGVFWSAAFVALFRDRPSEHPWARLPADYCSAFAPNQMDAPVSPAPAISPLAAAWIALTSSVALWLLCGQMFFRAFGYVFFTNWFPAYLEKSAAVSKLASSTLTLVPIFAVLLGGLVGGTVLDFVYRRTGNKWLSRSGTAVIALFACAACTLAAARAKDPTSAVVVISCGAFFAGIGGPVTWAAVIDVCGRRTALLLGLVNMCGNFGSIACVKSMGRVFDYIERTRSDWNLVLYLFAGIYVAAAMFWMFLNPADAAVADEGGPKVNS